MNKSRIKIIVIFLLLISLSVTLYLRRPKTVEWDPGWGQGQMKLSEKEYYRKRIDEIIHNWKEMTVSRPWRDDDIIPVFLVIDLDKHAIWIEEGGEIQKENYSEFPENMNWSFYYFTPSGPKELPGRTILRHKGTMLEQFYLAGTGLGMGHMYYNFGCFRNGSSWSYSSIEYELKNMNYFPESDVAKTIIVTDTEYQQYHNSLPKDDIKKPSTILKENEIRWHKVEKYLYMEINKQVHNAGYRLSTITVEPGPEFSAGHAIISCDCDTLLNKYFNIGGFRKVATNLNIIHLGNEVWYIKAVPNQNVIPEGQYKPDSRFTLEFIFLKDEDIKFWERRKLLKQGRSMMQTNPSHSKWQTSLPDGMIVEFIGVSENPSAGKQWWGPDGTFLDYPPYVNVNITANSSNSEERKFYDIAWRIKWPEGVTVKKNFCTFEGNIFSGHKNFRDKYGHYVSPVQGGILGFAKSQIKTTLTITVETDKSAEQEASFKNISLIPGQDQGFKIEVKQTEE